MQDETRPIRRDTYPDLTRVRQSRDRAYQARSMLGASVADTGNLLADREIEAAKESLDLADVRFKRAIGILTGKAGDE